MSLRYLVDAQLPPVLASKLRRNGFEALHLAALAMLRASDRDIWVKARELAAAIITNDEDFVLLSFADPAGPQVVHLRLGNMSNEALWRHLEAAMPAIALRLAAGERVIDVGR